MNLVPKVSSMGDEIKNCKTRHRVDDGTRVM